MLKEIFGHDRIIPGSEPSGFFDYKKLSAALVHHTPTTTDDHDNPFWSNMTALYTHTLLRPIGGGKTSNSLNQLRNKIPALGKKRFRLMTIVRRPLDLAASSFYETQCRIGTFANQKNHKGDIDDCPSVNLTDVMRRNIERKTKKCEEESRITVGCQEFQKVGGEKFFEHCGSIDKLFERGSVHNQHYKTLSGIFPRPPELGNDVDKIGINLTPTLEDVSLYTLRDLGGLVDYNPVHKEDFVWFAITERFTESMCLFYYRFEVEPVLEKKALYKKCRPLAFWEDKHKKHLEDNEHFDYTVWRAANAILDVRMEDMRLEIKDRLDAGEKLKDIPYLGPGCYVEDN